MSLCSKGQNDLGKSKCAQFPLPTYPQFWALPVSHWLTLLVEWIRVLVSETLKDSVSKVCSSQHSGDTKFKVSLATQQDLGVGVGEEQGYVPLPGRKPKKPWRIHIYNVGCHGKTRNAFFSFSLRLTSTLLLKLLILFYFTFKKYLVKTWHYRLFKT